MIGSWKLSDLQKQFAGLITKDVPFTGVSTDTRTIKPGDLFVALVGDNFDGHNFVEQALEKGAVAAVVSQPLAPTVAQWQVADTRIALGQIALANRQRFHGPVYAITGSSGKTTVKEMLKTVLAQKSTVLATLGNLNNDIGVPLTLMQLEDRHEVAVIEQGASAKGEIAYTTALSLPDVAILNNAMGAHLEGFGSLQGVVEAKSEIYSTLGQNQGVAILNLDDPHVSYWLEVTKDVQKRICFAVSNTEADVYASDVRLMDNGCYGFTLHRADESVAVKLNVFGEHNVANALAATAAVSAYDMPLQEVAEGLQAFEAVPGRMRPHNTPQGALLIDDSYNANPGSVCAAIDMLVSLPGESVLVLGDMAELGKSAAEQHKEVGCRAAQKGVGRLWVTGALSRHSVEAYEAISDGDAQCFDSKQELTAALKETVSTGMNVLVKGSRSAAMDQVVKGLVKGD